MSFDRKNEKKVETNLSLHESWKEKLPKEQAYVLSYKQSILEQLDENVISIDGVDIDLRQDGLVVNGYIRNALTQPLKMENVPLVIKVVGGGIAASKVFDLSVVGEIPPKSARPWTFLFENQYINFANIHLEEWELGFGTIETMNNMALEFPPQIETLLTEEIKNVLIKKLANLPTLNEGDFTVNGVELQKDKDGNIIVLTFLRNATLHNLTIDQMPLQLEDRTSEIVAVGTFQTNGLEIQSNTCKVWRFIFPKEILIKQTPDFSEWKIRIPQETEVETE